MTRPRVNRLRQMDDPAVARTYDRTMASYRGQYAQAAVIAHRAAPNASRILDVATGPGVLLCCLSREYPAAAVTGLDLSHAMLGVARDRIEAEGLAERVRLVHGSDYEMPFADASFDLLLATETIHMLDELPAFLREARRVLAPGGRLVILDHPRDVSLPIYALMWMTTAGVRLLRLPLDGMGPVVDACYTAAELEEALPAAGFSHAEVTQTAVWLQAVAVA